MSKMSLVNGTKSHIDCPTEVEKYSFHLAFNKFNRSQILKAPFPLTGNMSQVRVSKLPHKIKDGW